MVAGVGGVGVVVIYFFAINTGVGESDSIANLAKKDFSNEYSIRPIMSGNIIRKIFLIYIFIIFACSVCYFLLGVPIFDAFCSSVTTVATSGFLHNTNKFLIFERESIMLVATFFMFISGLPLILLISTIERRNWNIFNNSQILWFTIITLLLLLVSFSSCKIYNRESFVTSLFYSVSFITTTGFNISNQSFYLNAAFGILYISSIIGPCSGSTGGGIKVSRVLVFFKSMLRESNKKISPHSVLSVKIDNKTISEDSINSVLVMICTFVATFFFFVIILSFISELDLSRSVSLVISTLTTSGVDNNVISIFNAKSNDPLVYNLLLYISSFLMLVGRLEIFLIYSIFTKRFWTS